MPPSKKLKSSQSYTFSSAEFGSLTTSQLMEKVRGLQNLAFQLGLDEGMSLGCILYQVSQISLINKESRCHLIYGWKEKG